MSVLRDQVRKNYVQYGFIPSTIYLVLMQVASRCPNPSYPLSLASAVHVTVWEIF